MKRYDYRREFMHMNSEELTKRLISLKAEYDKWFVKAFADEQANAVWRQISYVERKIEKLKSGQP
tara:strand:- start:36 stop:230 length:195 start_codon:yes stop_codon:yes gene_type:complete